MEMLFGANFEAGKTQNWDRGQVRARSEEDADDELSCVVMLKSGKKVVCGSQLGVLTIFSWGQFADCSDRLPGEPADSQVCWVTDLCFKSVR